MQYALIILFLKSTALPCLTVQGEGKDEQTRIRKTDAMQTCRKNLLHGAKSIRVAWSEGSKKRWGYVSMLFGTTLIVTAW